MKDTKLFGSIFLLSIVVGIVIESARGIFEQNISKGSFLNTDHPIWAFGYGIVFGGGFGVILGLVSGAMLILILNSLGSGKIPIAYIIAFSLVVGGLELGFYFNLILKTLPSYSAVFRDEWISLVVGFISGFLKAFIPLIIGKKCFNL
ncbi:MAG: hypothetical protein AB1477_09160 [Acidobacteriota bacterium]|jgi:hypothetical protein